MVFTLESRADFQLPSSCNNNYFRLVQWSPDGSCFISSANDCKLRIFDLPRQLQQSQQQQPPLSTAGHSANDQLEEANSSKNNPDEVNSDKVNDNSFTLEESLVIKHSDPLYDFAWYPQMSSDDPVTCVFAISSCNCAIHLYDAYTGNIRATYKSLDHLEQLHSAHSVAFNGCGDKIYAGFRKAILRIFDVNSPGCDCQVISTYPQSGILSCITFNSFKCNMCAIGSFNKTISLVDPICNSITSVLQGQSGGVTHLKFSNDGNVLYSGGRKDCEIVAWDLRNLGRVLASYKRICDTNQKIYFDVKDALLFSGNTDGSVSLWNAANPHESEQRTNVEPVFRQQIHPDCINGISLHPTLPLLITCSGQRHFPKLIEDDSDDGNDSQMVFVPSKNVSSINNSINLLNISTE